jgi:hypothetical protein
MRTCRPSRLFLIVALLALAGLACSVQGQAAPTADPNVIALAVQQTLAASAGGETSGPPPATVPPSTDAAVAPTETPLIPTPTVTHVTFPANPGGVTSFMTDRSSAALAGERRSIADNFDVNLLERPFTSQVMDYRGYLDLNRGELSIGAPWIYVTLFLEQAPPPGTLAFYGVEVDIDVDGRGDYLITGAAPASTDWTTNGVRVLRDTNNDVGGARPMSADPPAGGTGYDELIFDQGQGPDPDAAWIRLAPASSSQVQIAFKYSVIGSPDEWTWGIWADEGVNKPEWFDYNDHFTAADAGSPTSGSSLYPIKALAAVDNSCRWAVGFTPDGDEPGICYIPPTPTPILPGSVRGLVFRDNNFSGGYNAGDSTYNGVTVTLRSGGCGGSAVASTTTNGSGRYEFTNITPGNYCVSVSVSAGEAGTCPCGGLCEMSAYANPRSVSVPSGGAANADFGFQLWGPC